MTILNNPGLAFAYSDIARVNNVLHSTNTSPGIKQRLTNWAINGIVITLVYFILVIASYNLRKFKRKMDLVDDPRTLSPAAYKSYMKVRDNCLATTTNPAFRFDDQGIDGMFLLKSRKAYAKLSTDIANSITANLLPLDDKAGQTANGFTVLSQDQLWKTRSKAYDYVL